LVELLVGMAISVILITVMLAVMTQISSSVRTADSKIDSFRSAQSGFDLMTQRLSDATLNTYYDYDSETAPTTYMRRSDLHFLIEQNANLTTLFPSANAHSGQSVFFQASTGYSNSSTYSNTPGLLNACGYFIQYGPNSAYWPSIFSTANQTVRYRYRLMQAIQATEYNNIFADQEGATPEGGSAGNATFPATPWFASLSPLSVPIAENVIALIIWPQSPSAQNDASAAVTVSSDYQYSSRQGWPTSSLTTSPYAIQAEQLPQILQITLVAIDAASATRLDTGSATPPTVIENALKGSSPPAFTVATAAQYASDLTALENALAAAKIHYEVLTASITLRESKWSNGQ
jgi:uncharacterized protein (TIGR02599 family)